MKKTKKIIGLICTIALTIGNTMPALACTPQFQAPKLPSFSDYKWEMPEKDKDAIGNAVDAYLEEKALEIPELTEAKYIHSRWFWRPSRLQVKWSEVHDATSYEIKVTKEDGTEETYTSNDTSLILTDIECPKQKIDGDWKSATVQVRAKDEDGKSSYWSEEENISCNALHR